MLRRLLTPRWLGWLALLTVAVVTVGVLGLWQLNVAKDRGTNQEVAQAPSRPVVALTEILKPHQSFPAVESSRRVTASGRYDADKQFVVADRRLDGKQGYWVVTPLVERTTGARLPILRGFVTNPEQATRPTATEVTVLGGLAPGESPSAASYPAGQTGSIDLSAKLNEWGGEVYNAFVFAMQETPNATANDIVRVPPPPPNPTFGFRFVNLMYAFQWWVFALFAIYVFWRMLRDEVHGRPERSPRRLPADNGKTDPRTSAQESNV